MKMLYIANVRMPTEKAHGLQIVKTIEAMQRLGAQVTLLIPWRKNHITKSLESFYNLSTPVAAIHVPDPLRLVQSANEPLYFFLQRLWFGAVSFVYALGWGGYIYSRDITISFALTCVGKRVVFEDHEPKQRLRWLYNIFVKKIKKKVIVARNLVDYYEKIGVDKNSYTIAPNGADINEFDRVPADRNIWHQTFGFDANKKVALYVGHFYQWKGIYTLLDAAEDIKAKVILIGGIPPDRQKVENYILEKKLTNVRVREFVPHTEIIKFIKSANVLVLPNTGQEERSAKYTTPIKLFEYMASNVPIVASKVNSFEGYLQNGKNALLCEPDDARSLSDAVNTVLDNDVLAKHIAAQAAAEAKKYDWSMRAQSILMFITS